MKKEITTAQSKTVVNTATITLTLPENNIYLKVINGSNDDNSAVIFAILPEYENNPTHTYRLVKISRNKMESTDFVPTDDCKNEYWLTERGLRKTAFEYFETKAAWQFSEISKWEFERLETILLTDYKKRIAF